MYEKYLRNKEMKEVKERYNRECPRDACGTRFEFLPQYPMRPPGKYPLVSIGGFKQHPDESQDM